VAGALGPTNKTLSLSPRVNEPGFRAVTFDEMQDAYQEQVRGLIDGGCDILLARTVFDTAHAQGLPGAPSRRSLPRRTWPCQSCCQEPSPTRAAALMSGQTVDAFYTSIKHARPLAVGLNCGGGAPQLRPYIEDLAGQADEYILCYPNAGLPNAFGGYDEQPADTATLVGELGAPVWSTSWADLRHTPDHIRDDREGRARRVSAAAAGTKQAGSCAGLDTLTRPAESNFISSASAPMSRARRNSPT